MTTDQWLSLINSVGLPTFFLLTLLFICWRSIKGVAPFLKEAYQSHMALVEDVRSSVQEQTRLLQDLQSDSTRSSAALRHAADAIEVIAPEETRMEVAMYTNQMKNSLGEG